jgi:hypothetical protein
MDRPAPPKFSDTLGDALARSFELVVTPAIFGVAGYFLDRKIGTVPLFTLLFAFFVLFYEASKLWRDYVAAMERHEQALPKARASQ